MALPPPGTLPEIMAWIRTRHLAQLFTLGDDGMPVGRSVGVLIRDDWSVDCHAERDRGRYQQVLRDPRLAIMWDDGGQPVPKVVFLRGVAEIQTGDELVAAYNRRIDNFTRRGEPRTPRPEAEVRDRMVNLWIRPAHIRIEGFGQGTESWEWPVSAAP